jgi:potassium-dependent mechanosensitive channel
VSSTASRDPIIRALGLASAGDGHMAKSWAEVLATIPLFEGVSQRHLRRIAALATAKRFAPYTAMVKEGTPGDAFYVILDGTATVRRPGKRNVTLRQGDFFGELALLDSSPRSATVEANDEVLAMRLGRAAFQKTLEKEPKVALAMLRTLATRLRASGEQVTH